MNYHEMADFLETDTLSFTFSPVGLKHLSLKDKSGQPTVNLRAIDERALKNAGLDSIIRETIAFLETGRHAMPLDLSELTEFQRSVFDIVGQIEPGQIITYKGIAEKLGKPGAAQAVGNAVAQNPVAYFLPTHRVLPQKGLGICRTGAGHLREKLLVKEGHDLAQLRGNYVCKRKKCCMK